MLRLLGKFNTQGVILSVLLAFVLGISLPQIFAPIQFIGDLFINLLKLFALPLIASALIASLGQMGGNFRKLKEVARYAVSYMLLSELAAVTIALVLFNAVSPGKGLSPDLILNGKDFTPPGHEGFSFSAFVLSIFPDNIFAALANFDLLPVVIFSIIFGVACGLESKRSQPILELMSSIREISNTCLHGVMLFAPFGIFSLVGNGVAGSYLSGNLSNNLVALANFVMVLFVGLFLHALWQLVLVILFTKQSAGLVLRKSLPVFYTAFGTSSSVATLPVAMEVANDLGAQPATTRFMLPLCASINIGGMMMYEVAAVLFFSQMLGFDLSLSQQMLVALMCILGGMAEGGIPETSMVSLVVVFKMVNIPLSAISILLPLDRLIDRVRTIVNIFGNMCGVIVVSQMECDVATEEVSETVERRAIATT